jgi:hypothetical protein
VCLSEGRKVAFAERRLLMISKVRDGIRACVGSYIWDGAFPICIRDHGTSHKDRQ